MSDHDHSNHPLGPYLAIQLWSWSVCFFQPALQLKRHGMYHPHSLGPLPGARSLPPLPPDLSSLNPEPVMLEHTPGGYDSVEAFDTMAPLYESAVRPFADPIQCELLELIRPHLTPASRVLDPSAGTGLLARRLAAELPDGEVVAADLSRGMVTHAANRARECEVTNMAFFQADVEAPPCEFHGYFDAAMSCLSFHHYPDGAAAAKGLLRVLRPGGKLFIADGGPQWFVDLARGVSMIADPGFVKHRTGEEFSELLLEAGFSEVYWEEGLPGIGFTVAST